MRTVQRWEMQYECSLETFTYIRCQAFFLSSHSESSTLLYKMLYKLQYPYLATLLGWCS